MTRPDAARLTAWVEGRVQGVGFRWWVRARALEQGLSGYAENLADGRVKVVAEGTQAACDQLLTLIAGDPLPGPAGAASVAASPAFRARPGQVRRVTHRWGVPSGGMTGFAER